MCVRACTHTHTHTHHTHTHTHTHTHLVWFQEEIERKSHPPQRSPPSLPPALSAFPSPPTASCLITPLRSVHIRASHIFFFPKSTNWCRRCFQTKNTSASRVRSLSPPYIYPSPHPLPPPRGLLQGGRGHQVSRDQIRQRFCAAIGKAGTQGRREEEEESWRPLLQRMRRERRGGWGRVQRSRVRILTRWVMTCHMPAAPRNSTFVHTHTHTHTHHVYIYICVCVYIYIYIYIYIYTDTRTHSLTHTHAHTHAITHVHARTHARSHARTHARTHIPEIAIRTSRVLQKVPVISVKRDLLLVSKETCY